MTLQNKANAKARKNTSSANRSKARLRVLRAEGQEAASSLALSRQARKAAKQRGPKERHEAAMKAVHTKGRQKLRHAARKAARTRKRAA